MKHDGLPFYHHSQARYTQTNEVTGNTSFWLTLGSSSGQGNWSTPGSSSVISFEIWKYKWYLNIFRLNVMYSSTDQICRMYNTCVWSPEARKVMHRVRSMISTYFGNKDQTSIRMCANDEAKKNLSMLCNASDHTVHLSTYQSLSYHLLMNALKKNCYRKLSLLRLSLYSRCIANSSDPGRDFAYKNRAFHCLKQTVNQ
jgi:hypothetical protein